MKPIELYEWIAGTMSNFTKPFQENEALFNQAKAFWRHLDSSLMIAIVTFVLTFVVTWGFEYFAVKPVLKGAAMLELKIAFGNAIYASIIYLLTSVAWCNWFPTNAYRLLKF